MDKDGGGSIDAHEFKTELYNNQKIDDAVWNKVIGEVDKNGDGEIEFEEF